MEATFPKACSAPDLWRPEMAFCSWSALLGVPDSYSPKTTFQPWWQILVSPVSFPGWCKFSQGGLPSPEGNMQVSTQMHIRACEQLNKEATVALRIVKYWHQEYRIFMFMLKEINIQVVFLYIEMPLLRCPWLDLHSDVWFMKLHTRIMAKLNNQAQVWLEINFQVVISVL